MKVWLLLSLFIAGSIGNDYFTQEPPTYIIGSYGDIITFNCTASSDTFEVHLLVGNSSSTDTHEGITVTRISLSLLMVTVNISISTSELQITCIAIDKISYNIITSRTATVIVKEDSMLSSDMLVSSFTSLFSHNPQSPPVTTDFLLVTPGHSPHPHSLSTISDASVYGSSYIVGSMPTIEPSTKPSTIKDITLNELIGIILGVTIGFIILCIVTIVGLIIAFRKRIMEYASNQLRRQPVHKDTDQHTIIERRADEDEQEIHVSEIPESLNDEEKDTSL